MLEEWYTNGGVGFGNNPGTNPGISSGVGLNPNPNPNPNPPNLTDPTTTEHPHHQHQHRHAHPRPLLLNVPIGDERLEHEDVHVVSSPKAQSTGDLTSRIQSQALSQTHSQAQLQSQAQSHSHSQAQLQSLGHGYEKGQGQEKGHEKGPYELLVKERMMGLYLAVFVHRDVKNLVRGTSKSAVTTGLIGGRLGNKGGVGVSVNVDGTTLLFINAHLAGTFFSCCALLLSPSLRFFCLSFALLCQKTQLVLWFYGVMV
ncbi:hypothetical protein K474DRAFT_170948 [Panus rudis PR-1116 ss-1]|nr:hypothetical protein K474DRAFT_170948 [Panus rudis PR-1116 ss-1]